MTEFIRNGNEIRVTPNFKVISYSLESNIVYDLKFNRMEGYVYLQKNGSLNLPKKLYKLEDDDKFIDRTLTYFNSEKAGLTTGILLAGTKGTGKTMLAKRIAIESNLPIVVVATDFPASKLTPFFKEFTTPVCILFDEIEKNTYYWEPKDLLGFLDGVEATAKKLVLMTCNNTNKIDDNMFDRCSRIRYFKKYEADSNEVFIRFMAEDKGIDNVDEVVNFIKNNIKVKSFDNILAFLDEVLLFNKYYSLEELAVNMNISIINDLSKIKIHCAEDETEYDYEDETEYDYEDEEEKITETLF